jgi:hypothetical protein
MVEARRPSLALSSYNHQWLTHEEELARRRHQSHQRSQRAAAEALRTLRAERELDRRELHHGHEEKIGTPAATAAKDPAV